MKLRRTRVAAATSLLLLSGWIGLSQAASVRFAEDFSDAALPADRFAADASGESSVSVENGRVRITAVADDERVINTRLRLIGETDYFEADASISRETIATGTGRSRVQMYGILYNDTAEGGFDGYTGDVWAGITLGKDHDDSLWVFACLERSDDAQFLQISSLLFNDAGNECVHLAPPLQPEFDKPVTMSISLDREAGKVLFSVDDQTVEHIINTPIFTSANESKAVKAQREEGAGTSIVYVDNVRTDPSASFTDDSTAGENGTVNENEGGNASQNPSSTGGDGGGGALGFGFLLTAFAAARLTRRRVSQAAP